MRQCPECNRVYYDERLNFCLDDGAELLHGPASDESETAILSEPLQVRSPTADAEKTDALQKRPDRRKPFVAGALGIILVSLIAFGGYWFYGRSSSRQIDSIAVMPFANASGNPEFEYLSDGMTESLIGMLLQVPNMNVKAYSSVLRYKGTTVDAPTVGRELNVQALLNGRLVQRGEELTLYIELVDANTENSLWKQTYNKPLTNLIALQNDIARDVADKLQVRLSGTKTLTRNYTENAEAHRLYLLGRFHWNKRNKTDIERAIEYYQQAVGRDPNYALALAGLADAYALLPGYDPGISPLESQSKAREYALKALSLDDSLSEAHVSHGLVLQGVDLDFKGAEREFVRALELDPKNTVAYQYYGLLLAGLGRFKEAEANLLRALEIEPSSVNLNRNYGAFLQVARRYEESEKQLRKTIELDPTFQVAKFTLANTLMLQGKYAECVEIYAQSREAAGRPDQAAVMRDSFSRGGWRGFVLAYPGRNSSAGERPRYVDATRLVTIGENDKALEMLEASFVARESFLQMLNVDPRLDPLRDEPRFKELLQKAGFE